MNQTTKPRRSRNQVARDGFAALAMVALAATLVTVVIGHFIS